MQCRSWGGPGVPEGGHPLKEGLSVDRAIPRPHEVMTSGTHAWGTVPAGSTSLVPRMPTNSRDGWTDCLARIDRAAPQEHIPHGMSKTLLHGAYPYKDAGSSLP